MPARPTTPQLWNASVARARLPRLDLTQGGAWAASVPLILIGVCASVLAVQRLAVGLAVVGQSAQLDYAEPIIYAQAARIPNGQALYQPIDRAPYTVTAYFPLFYKLASQLQVRVGPGFTPGRLASFVALLIAACVIAWIATTISRSRLVGLLAAALYIGVSFPGPVPWFALYRVDLVAEALAVLAIGVLIHGSTTGHVLLAAVLAGLAILTKQSYVAAAVAGTFWLWSIGQKRMLLFAGACACLVLGVCVVQQLTTGQFVANTFGANVNPVNLEECIALLMLLAQTLGLPILVGLGWVLRTRAWRATPRTKLLVTYWAVSTIQLAGLIKFGAIHNYWIEFAAPTAVFAAVGLWSVEEWLRCRSPRLSAVLLWSLGVNLALLGPLSVAAQVEGRVRAETPAMQPSDQAAFDSLVALVRSQGGPVLADPLDVVALAGRPVYLEPVIFAVLDGQGRWDPTPVVRQICAGQVPLLVLGIPLEPLSELAWNGQPWWPPAVMRALRERMQFSDMGAGRYIYTPAATLREPPPGVQRVC